MSQQIPDFLRGDSKTKILVEAIERLDLRVSALEREFDMELTGFSPDTFPQYGENVFADVTGSGFTDPWVTGGEYILAFRRNGTVGDPNNVRPLMEWTDTTLTTAYLSDSYFNSPGSYDAYLIKSDDQGDPIVPYIQMSNLLENACYVEGPPS